MTTRASRATAPCHQPPRVILADCLLRGLVQSGFLEFEQSRLKIKEGVIRAEKHSWRRTLMDQPTDSCDPFHHGDFRIDVACGEHRPKLFPTDVGMAIQKLQAQARHEFNNTCKRGN